ncbi:Gfo/Idh/MocA family protein [Glutamicibacter arilaitensis]|uniref:Gfo/Idh/MocA family protein n=1 Tax=Glutamicibacter arilaitensis TaxID=256701 RepID=UPI00384A89B8
MSKLNSHQVAPSMQNLRVGVIGGGFMAKTHAQAIRRAGAQLVGVRSNGDQSTQAASRALGATAMPNIDSLLELCDVVHVTTPNALHAQQVASALESGVAVVCEKPLGVSAQEAEHLVKLAKDANVIATVPFVYRFHPMVRQARAHVREGKLGRLLTVRGEYFQDWMHSVADSNWRVEQSQGGASRAFGDIGSHLVDLLEFISSERIVRINAATSIAHEHRGGTQVDTEDVAVLSVQMQSGAIGSLMVSQVNAGRKNTLNLELSGVASAIEFVQERPEELWIGKSDVSQILSRQSTELSEDAARLSVVPAGHPMGYLDAFAAFVADTYTAIGGNQPEGLPTFLDGARAASLTEAVLLSARSGQWVDTNE